MTAPKRPVLRYHGGKWRIAPWLVSLMPPHECYVEPFAGGGSVLLTKPQSEIEVYNDLDECVVNLFRILRDPEQAERLRQSVELTPFARAEFEACWAVADNPLEEARRLIVRSFQAIGNKSRLSRNGWRTRTPKSHGSPCTAWNGWPDQVPAFVMRLRETIIECRPWQDVLGLYDDASTLFYVDPPYLASTRSDGYRKVYAHEMTEADHVELLDRLNAAKGLVMLSGYRSELYDAALPNWTRLEQHARAQHNRARVEVVWLNPRAAAATQQSELAL